MNLHDPQRLENESFEQYKLRRKLAARLVKVNATGQVSKFQRELIERFKKGEIK